MNFDDVILGRRSIRGYLKKPVPKALVREILQSAMRAPTSLNTQPWNFYVVAGDVLDRGRPQVNRQFRSGTDVVRHQTSTITSPVTGSAYSRSTSAARRLRPAFWLM